jgi:hypothetical protein
MNLNPSQQSLVERMALAMWREREKHFPQRAQHDPDQLDVATGAWVMMLEQARAGLESLHSPTDEQFGGRFGSAARRQWDDMVSAALKQFETNHAA